MEDNQRQALLAYLAGIIDGEGCFTICKNSKKQVYSFKMVCGMTDPTAPNLLKETFGGQVYVDGSNRYRPMYRWHLAKREVLKEVIPFLLPYLRVKKEQAELLLEAARNCIKSKNERISDDELRYRQELHLRMKKLNAVGAAATTNREDTREGEVIV